MTVIMDAYGGDHAPLEVLRGTAEAVRELGVQAIICGNESELRELAAQKNIPLEGMQFVHAVRGMPVEEDSTEILKGCSDTSMAVGMKLLAKGGGDAFVSAGSTGAQVVGASLIVKRMRGVKRPVLGTVIPTTTGCYMLMDVGANAECRPEMLQQFAIMGSIYMQKIMGVASPRVGIVNIGTENNKGLSLQIETAKLLQDAPINFIGNIEARELPLGGCDVAVTDGFTGNVILKLTEGMGKMMQTELKKIFMHSFASKLAALILSSGLRAFRKNMDYSEYGGAPLLGASAPVIKAHGSSKAKAFKNAIRQAKRVCDGKVTEVICQALADLKEKEGAQ